MNPPIRIVLADDEELALEGVGLVLAREPGVQIVGQARDGESAVAMIRERRPDLVFLDINMPRLDGFEVVRRLAPEERPAVVFVTAYDRYAIQAFELAAVDYLLKPFSDVRLREALARAKERLRRQDVQAFNQHMDELLKLARRIAGPEGAAAPGAEPPPQPAASEEPNPVSDRLLIKTGNDLALVKTRDIVWIEAEGDYVKVHASGRPQLVRTPLHQLEKRLPSRGFARIHRSTIVNLEHVVKVTPALYGDYHVFMTDGERLRLSRTFREHVRHLLPPALA